MKILSSRRAISIAIILFSLLCLFFGWIGINPINVGGGETKKFHELYNESKSRMLDEIEYSRGSDRDEAKFSLRLINAMKNDSISPAEEMTLSPSILRGSFLDNVQRLLGDMTLEDIDGFGNDIKVSTIIVGIKCILVLTVLTVVIAIILALLLVAMQFVEIPILSDNVQKVKKAYAIDVLLIFVINVIFIIVINELTDLSSIGAHITLGAFLGLVSAWLYLKRPEEESALFEWKLDNIKLFTICPSCGKQILARTRFCPNCGTKNDGGEPSGSEEKVCFCSFCGKQISASTRFCPNCRTQNVGGAPLKPNNIVTPPSPYLYEEKPAQVPPTLQTDPPDPMPSSETTKETVEQKQVDRRFKSAGEL